MTASTKLSDSPAASEEIAERLERVKLFGIEWPIPRWAVGLGAFILLLAMVASLTNLLVIPAIERWELRHDDSTRRQMEEWKRHFNEAPIGQSEDLGNLINVKLYGSDGCLLVSRKTGGQLWVPDLSRVERDPAPGPVAQVSGALPWEGVAWAQAQGGTCRDPHPGSFEQWQGERRNCWVQVFRKWSDGCTQYQWFDSCYNVWDTDSDGKPKIYWSVCNH